MIELVISCEQVTAARNEAMRYLPQTWVTDQLVVAIYRAMRALEPVPEAPAVVPTPEPFTAADRGFLDALKRQAMGVPDPDGLSLAHRAAGLRVRGGT